MDDFSHTWIWTLKYFYFSVTPKRFRVVKWDLITPTKSSLLSHHSCIHFYPFKLYFWGGVGWTMVLFPFLFIIFSCISVESGYRKLSNLFIRVRPNLKLIAQFLLSHCCIYVSCVMHVTDPIAFQVGNVGSKMQNVPPGLFFRHAGHRYEFVYLMCVWFAMQKTRNPCRFYLGAEFGICYYLFIGC